MATLYPPKKNTVYAFELAVYDNAGKFLTGAVFSSKQVYLDGALLGTITGAPAEIGASGMYVISLTAAEMNADRVALRFVITGAPDVTVNLNTVDRQFNDLAFPNVSGNGMDVASTGEVGLDYSNIKQAGAPVTLSNVTIPTVTTLTNGSSDISAIQAKTVNLPSDPADESLLEAAISANTAAVTTQTDIIKAKTNLIPASPAAVGSQMDLVDAPNATAVTAIQSGLATSANLTTLLNRVGAFTGSGVNTVLGFLRAMSNKAGAVVTPSDLSASGTFTNTTDSLEAVRDATGGSGGATASEIADEVQTRTIARVTVVDAVTGAVGSVTGNVGGNVVGNVNGNVGGNIAGTVPDSAGTTTLLSRITSGRALLFDNLAVLAGWSGTLLTALRALTRKNVASADIGGTYDGTTDSLEAAREKLDTLSDVTPTEINENITELDS